MTQKQGAKPFDIDRWKLYYAYQRVNQNRGGSGVDDVTLEKYNCNLKRNLYKLWNRMSSGSYIPKPVRLVQKATTKIRATMRSWNLKSKSHTPLDCIAQMVKPILRGWANYYGKYGGKSFQKLLRYFDLLLAKWAKAKYKTFRDASPCT